MYHYTNLKSYFNTKLAFQKPQLIITLIAVIVLSRLVLSVLGYAATNQLGSLQRQHPNSTSWQIHKDPSRDNVGKQVLKVWVHWDSYWYLSIAKNGYSNKTSQKGEGNLVFFPLYPLLIYALTDIFNSPILAGLLINLVCLVFSLFFLYKIAEHFWDSQVAWRATLLLLFAPFSFYLSGVLSEGLFLALSLGCFYYAYKDKWWLTGLLAGLLTLTRPVGVLIIVPLIILWWRSHAGKKTFQDKRWLYLLAVPLAFAIFLYIQWKVGGDPLAFQKIELSGWGREIQAPWLIIPRFFSSTGNAFRLTLGLLPIGIVLALRKKLSPELVVWTLIVIVPGLLSSITDGLQRYTVVIFPAFLGLAILTRHRERTYDILLVTFGLLQGAFFLAWVLNAPFLA